MYGDRKIDAGGSKRCHEEGEYEAVNRAGPSYSQGDEPEEENTACSGRPSEGTYAHVKDQSKRLDQAQEVWAAPWETEKAENVAAHKAVASKESSDAAVLKARTVDDGIRSYYHLLPAWICFNTVILVWLGFRTVITIFSHSLFGFTFVLLLFSGKTFFLS